MESFGKATSLDAILRAFTIEALDEKTLPLFYYDNTIAIRTGDEWDSPLEDLFTLCTTPMDTNAHLLIGHRGCGKSTEMNNLKQKFEDAGHPTWIVASMVETELGQVNHWDIMLLVTVGLCNIAANKGITLPAETITAIFDYLKKDTEETKTIEDSDSAQLKVGAEAKTPALLSGVIKLFAGITTEMKASQTTRRIVREKMERRASEWINSIKEISNWITDGCDGKQPILIFEDLDKLPRSEKSFEIFSYSVLAQMPFPIIYTFPISQFYSSEFGTIRDFYRHHILPMIKVSNLDGSPNSDGIAVMKKIVELRAELDLFDGGGSEDSVLELLIKKTGGSLRDLFKCVVSAANRATRRGVARIELEDVERALSDLSYELTAQISQPDYPMLADIYCNPRFREQIPDRDFLLKMMQKLVVLEYRNGTRWHDLQPLIAEFLIEQGVIDESKR